MSTAFEIDACDLQWDSTDLIDFVDNEGYHWSQDWYEMNSDASDLLSFFWIKNKFEVELEKELGWCEVEEETHIEKAAEENENKKTMVDNLQWKNVTQRKKKIAK